MKAKYRILLHTFQFAEILRHRPYRLKLSDRFKRVFRLSRTGRRITAAIMDWYEYGSGNNLAFGGVSFRYLVQAKNIAPLDAFLELDALRRSNKQQFNTNRLIDKLLGGGVIETAVAIK